MHEPSTLFHKLMPYFQAIKSLELLEWSRHVSDAMRKILLNQRNDATYRKHLVLRGRGTLYRVQACKRFVDTPVKWFIVARLIS